MSKFNVGDNVKHRPNHKVEAWKMEVVDVPPLHKERLGRTIKMDRYALKILEPHGGEIVNLPEEELEEVFSDE